MKLSSMWRSLLENWPIKVISLLLAISVYLVISYATLDTRRVEVPLHVVVPVGYEATSTIPDSVTLVIRTDERYIGMIDPTAVTAIADFSAVSQDGVATVPVLLEADSSFVDIEVSFTSEPELVKIFFRRLDRPKQAEEQDLSGGIAL
ncbi:MAG TPA: hypothetical protein VKZ39_03975 [Sphaerochaetaceae bacterium]|nr:hypothetical protein [Sphaerochaetaceae bacterium]